jgi:hypothetical protein
MNLKLWPGDDGCDAARMMMTQEQVIRNSPMDMEDDDDEDGDEIRSGDGILVKSVEMGISARADNS